jgi:NMD protein affecting ribosome stability and mRNA decay
MNDKCEGCGKNIYMTGSKLCPICDFDIDAIIAGTAKGKTPNLCDTCHEKHRKAHNSPGMQQTKGGDIP